MTAEGALPVVHESCPKRMVFGPCGGVRADGSCEMRPGPCAFDAPVAFPHARTGSGAARTPLILADLTAPPFDVATTRSVAGVLAEHCDAVLVGEHSNRPDLPPTLLAQHLLDAGATPWITLACRDRNRVVLEQELRGLLAVGVHAVLCVTGDGRAFNVRSDVTQVFDLDGTRLAALANDLGLTAAVAETPTAHPREHRPFRLLQKQHAGAGVAVLNYVPTAVEVEHFVSRARAIGLSIPVVAAVAVFTDAPSAAGLDGLPGLNLDPSVVGAVLAADDPVEAGIAAAVRTARGLLAVPGVAGVNLSGAASAGDPMAGADIKAEIARRIVEQESNREVQPDP